MERKLIERNTSSDHSPCAFTSPSDSDSPNISASWVCKVFSVFLMPSFSQLLCAIICQLEFRTSHERCWSESSTVSNSRLGIPFAFNLTDILRQAFYWQQYCATVSRTDCTAVSLPKLSWLPASNLLLPTMQQSPEIHMWHEWTRTLLQEII